VGQRRAEYKNVARAAAAQALYNRGDYEAAAEHVVRLASELDLAALPPRVSIGSYVFSYSRRGPAGWQVAFAAWRDRVLAGSSFEHVMALLPVANGRPGDMSTLLERARVLAGDDIDRKLDVAQAALRQGQPAFARQLIEPMLAAKPPAQVLELAAQLAQARGNIAEAFGYLERAQDAGANEAVDLDTVRGELRRLLATAQQAAMQATGPERTKLVARALDWGKRWRMIDPGNDEIDRTLGTLLLAVGDGPGAWRQLSSIIERDPWAGSGYAAVAEQLEQQGKIADALEVWQQAIVIDQTNPQHRLRKAQALIALGKTQEGDALLQQIATAKWHDMWLGTVYQAKDLLERGKRKK
jgi:tetratricopeptide (TPR) repeat protein